MVGIYKITSPTNRIYVGQSLNIDDRKKDYNQNGCLKNQPKIYRSIQKYGWNKHKHEIIEECTLEQLDERETYWKIYYLNLVGGDWDKVLFCGLYDKGGGPKSKEWRQNISDSHPTKKPVTQFTLEGAKVKDYISINEASRQTGIRVGDISAICNGKQKTSHGTIWMFKDESLRPIPKKRKKKTISKKHRNNISKALKNNKFKFGKGKPIIQYDLQNNLIKEWLGGAAEVERELGFNHKAIQNNLKNICKTSNGFIWKFKKKVL